MLKKLAVKKAKAAKRVAALKKKLAAVKGNPVKAAKLKAKIAKQQKKQKKLAKRIAKKASKKPSAKAAKKAAAKAQKKLLKIQSKKLAVKAAVSKARKEEKDINAQVKAAGRIFQAEIKKLQAIAIKRDNATSKAEKDALEKQLNDLKGKFSKGAVAAVKKVAKKKEVCNEKVHCFVGGWICTNTRDNWCFIMGESSGYRSIYILFSKFLYRCLDCLFQEGCRQEGHEEADQTGKEGR